MGVIDFLTDDREIYLSYKWAWILILGCLACCLIVTLVGAGGHFRLNSIGEHQHDQAPQPIPVSSCGFVK